MEEINDGKGYRSTIDISDGRRHTMNTVVKIPVRAWSTICVLSPRSFWPAGAVVLLSLLLTGCSIGRGGAASPPLPTPTAAKATAAPVRVAQVTVQRPPSREATRTIRQYLCALLPVTDTVQRADQRYQDARGALDMELNDSAAADAQDAATFARRGGSMLSRLHPPGRLHHANALLGSATSLYAEGATLLARALKKGEHFAVPSDADAYTRATDKMRTATAELGLVKREIGWRGDTTECQEYVPVGQGGADTVSRRHSAPPAPQDTPQPAQPSTITSPASSPEMAYVPPTPRPIVPQQAAAPRMPAAPAYSAPSSASRINARLAIWTKATGAGIQLLSKGHSAVKGGVDNVNARDVTSSALYLGAARADFQNAADVFANNPPPMGAYRGAWSRLHDSAVKQAAAIASLLRAIENRQAARECAAANLYSDAVAEQFDAQKELISSLAGLSSLAGGSAAASLPTTSWRALRCAGGGAPAQSGTARPTHAPAPAPPPASAPAPAQSPALLSYAQIQRRGLTHLSTAVSFLTTAVGEISAGDVLSGARDLQHAHVLLANESAALQKRPAAPASDLRLVNAREQGAMNAFLDAYAYASRALLVEGPAQTGGTETLQTSLRSSATDPRVRAYTRAAQDGLLRGGLQLRNAGALLDSIHA